MKNTRKNIFEFELRVYVIQGHNYLNCFLQSFTFIVCPIVLESILGKNLQPLPMWKEKRQFSN